jgi:hypothetical protein
MEHIGARWQFIKYLRLGSTEHKGLYQLFNRTGRQFITQLNRVNKSLMERFKIAQQARIQEAEQTPQLTQMIFNGGCRLMLAGSLFLATPPLL